MVPGNEHKLIERILAGDTKAFEEIVTEYHKMVYTLAFRVLKNHEEAQEIAQDVFLKVFQSLNKFKMGSKLSTWIYRITYNTSLNRFKSQKREVKTVDIDGYNEQDFLNSQNALDNMSMKEKRKIINESLLKLPEADKIIVTLYSYEELPIKEIADIVGISTHIVKIKLYRSRQKLYVELKDKVGEEKLDYYEYS